MGEFVRLQLFDSRLIPLFSGKDISIFSTPTWNEILQKGFGVSACYYCLEERDQILLCLPGILFDYKWIRIFYANMPYGEFIGDGKYIPTFLTLLESYFRKERIHLIRIAQLGDTNIEWGGGYHRRNGYQHLLHLTGLNPETLLESYKSSIQRNIRKAERSGVIASEIEKKSEMEDLYRLYLETMRRNSAIPVWTRRFFDAVYDLLVRSGEASILFAKWKEKIIAGMILIHSKDTTSYFLGASDTAYHSLRPNDFLFHTAILNSLKTGKGQFDFMTCSEQDEELSRFKEKWGAKRYPFIVYEKELDSFRAKIWKGVWKTGNSKIGSYLTCLLMKWYR
jgi:hypothetical protein